MRIQYSRDGNHENRRKYGEQRNVYTKFELKDYFGVEFVAFSGELMQGEALTSLSLIRRYRRFEYGAHVYSLAARFNTI